MSKAAERRLPRHGRPHENIRNDALVASEAWGVEALMVGAKVERFELLPRKLSRGKGRRWTGPTPTRSSDLIKLAVRIIIVVGLYYTCSVDEIE